MTPAYLLTIKRMRNTTELSASAHDRFRRWNRAQTLREKAVRVGDLRAGDLLEGIGRLVAIRARGME